MSLSDVNIRHDSWRSEAAIKKVVPHRVNGLWGTEDVKGKSWRWCRGEEGEEGEGGGGRGHKGSSRLLPLGDGSQMSDQSR